MKQFIRLFDWPSSIINFTAFFFGLICLFPAAVSPALLEIATCGNPQVNPNSRWDYNESSRTLHWFCSSAYRLVGTASSRCGYDGEWTPAHSPYCAFVDHILVEESNGCLNSGPEGISWLRLRNESLILGLELSVERRHTQLSDLLTKVSDRVEIFGGGREASEETGIIFCDSIPLVELLTAGLKIIKCTRQVKAFSVGFRIQGSTPVTICKMNLLINATRSCASGSTWSNGKCHFLLRSVEPIVWTEAKQRCRRQNATLSSATSHSVTLSLMPQHEKQGTDEEYSVWTGLKQQRPNQPWTTDGNIRSFDHSFVEDSSATSLLPVTATWPLCASVGGATGRLEARPCSARLPTFLCAADVTGCGAPALDARTTLAAPLRHSYAVDTLFAYYVRKEVYCMECKATGLWSHPSLCSESDEAHVFLSAGSNNCAVPPTPPFGTVTVRGQTVLAAKVIVAEYRCRRGYVIRGAATRTCLAGRRWSGAEPVCVGATCATPPSVRNGGHMVSSSAANASGVIGVGATVLYSCDTGHLLVGVNRLECLASGDWSAAWPSCAEIRRECAPLTITNAELIYLDETRNAGDRVLITCRTNHEVYPLDAFPTVVCTEAGAWNATLYCIRQRHRALIDTNRFPVSSDQATSPPTKQPPSRPTTVFLTRNGVFDWSYAANAMVLVLVGLLLVLSAGCCVAAIVTRRRTLRENRRRLAVAATVSRQRQSLRVAAANQQLIRNTTAAPYPLRSPKETRHPPAPPVKPKPPLSSYPSVSVEAGRQPINVEQLQKRQSARRKKVTEVVKQQRQTTSESTRKGSLPTVEGAASGRSNGQNNYLEAENAYEKPYQTGGSQRHSRRHSYHQPQKNTTAVSSPHECECDVYVTDQLPMGDEMYFSDSVMSRPVRYYYSEAMESNEESDSSSLLMLDDRRRDYEDMVKVPQPKRLNRSYSCEGRQSNQFSVRTSSGQSTLMTPARRGGLAIAGGDSGDSGFVDDGGLGTTTARGSAVATAATVAQLRRRRRSTDIATLKRELDELNRRHTLLMEAGGDGRQQPRRLIVVNGNGARSVRRVGRDVVSTRPSEIDSSPTVDDDGSGDSLVVTGCWDAKQFKYRHKRVQFQN